jgi:hypothetical protein
MDDLTASLANAIDDKVEHGGTTLIEAIINQELGEPFRRAVRRTNPEPVDKLSSIRR